MKDEIKSIAKEYAERIYDEGYKDGFNDASRFNRDSVYSEGYDKGVADMQKVFDQKYRDEIDAAYKHGLSDGKEVVLDALRRKIDVLSQKGVCR